MHWNDLAGMAREATACLKASDSAAGRRPWELEDVALGLAGDVGDLAKVIQARVGVRGYSPADGALEHELADCMWSLMTIVDIAGIDLERSFIDAMDRLGR